MSDLHLYKTCPISHSLSYGGHGKGNGIPDNKVHGANMGPTWGRQDLGEPHDGHTNLAIWDVGERDIRNSLLIRQFSACFFGSCTISVVTFEESGGCAISEIYPDGKGAHLGLTGPRWASCWPHDLCYLGSNTMQFSVCLREHFFYY